MPARNVAREPKIFISGANFLSPAKARAIADRNDMLSKIKSVIKIYDLRITIYDFKNLNLKSKIVNLKFYSVLFFQFRHLVYI